MVWSLLLGCEGDGCRVSVCCLVVVWGVRSSVRYGGVGTEGWGFVVECVASEESGGWGLCCHIFAPSSGPWQHCSGCTVVSGCSCINNKGNNETFCVWRKPYSPNNNHRVEFKAVKKVALFSFSFEIWTNYMVSTGFLRLNLTKLCSVIALDNEPFIIYLYLPLFLCSCAYLMSTQDAL